MATYQLNVYELEFYCESIKGSNDNLIHFSKEHQYD